MQNEESTAGETAKWEDLKANALGIALSLREPLKSLHDYNGEECDEMQRQLEWIIDGLYHFVPEEGGAE